MANIILCIGNKLSEDPHVDDVQKKIKTLDSEARVVRFELMLDGHFVEITAGNVSENNTSSCLFVVDGERIPAESITAVWYLWNPVTRQMDRGLQGYIADDFATQEWRKVIRSLESYVSHARWLNPLDALDMAECKPHQLLLAQQVGLTVPKTAITNNPEAVEKLFDEGENGRAISKTLTRLFIEPNNAAYTTEIQKDFPSTSGASITQCPAIYQELVERHSDLRITVVGRKVFPVRIASQILEDQKDRLDWRRCQDRNELYSVAEVSESFKERLLKFHEKAGLVFGGYDFLERGDDVIFLECNPCRAAWLWLEKAVGINVSQNVALYLLGKEDTDAS